MKLIEHARFNRGNMVMAQTLNMHYVHYIHSLCQGVCSLTPPPPSVTEGPGRFHPLPALIEKNALIRHLILVPSSKSQA